MNSDIQFGLKLKVDASESQKFNGVASDVGRVTQAARQSGTAMSGTSAEVQKLIDKYDPLGTKLKQLQVDFNALSAAAKGGLVGGLQDAQYDKAMGSLVSQMRDLQAAAEGAGPAAGAALGEVAVGAERAVFATAQARREMIVLGHEAISGNFARMPGSFMVLAERMGATATLFSPMVLGFAALAIAGGTFAYQAVKGALELSHFNDAMQLTGGMSGLTRDSLDAMSESITTMTGSVVKSRAMLEALSATGRFTAGEIESVGSAALDFANLSGESADKVAKLFAGMTENTVKWAEKTNEQYHYLDVVQYEHIRALVEQGDKELAVIEVSSALNKSMPATTERVGFLKAGVLGLGMAWDVAKNAMMNFGRDALNGLSDNEAVKQAIENENEIRQSLADASQRTFGGPATAVLKERLEAARKVTLAAIDKANRDEIAANQKAIYTKTQQAAIAASDELSAIQKSVRTKAQIRADEAKKIRDDAEAVNAGALAAGKQRVYDEDQIQQLILAADQKYKNSPVRHGLSAGYTASRAQAEQRIQLINDAARGEQEAEKKRVTLLLDTDTEYATKQFSIEEDRIRRVMQIRAQEYTSAQKGGDQRGMATALGQMQKLAQDYGNAYTKMGDSVALANKKMEDATRRANQVVSQLQTNFAKQNEAVQRGMEIMPAAQRQLETSLAKVDDAGKKAGEQIAKMFADGKIDAATYADEMAKVTNATESQRLKTIDLNNEQQALNASWENGTTKALTSYQDTLQNVSKTAENFVTTSLKGIEDAFVKLATTGKLTIRDLFGTLEQEAARAVYQQQFAPVVSTAVGGLSAYIGGLFGGGTAGSSINAGSNAWSADAFTLASANGNVFDNTGIVNSPTLFKFANGTGLMGEAGPEAIMPLSRGADGKLGVRAQGDGSGTGVQIQVIDQRSASNSAPVDVQQTTGSGGAQQVALIIRDAVRSQLNGGGFDSALRTNFGLSRTLTRR